MTLSGDHGNFDGKGDTYENNIPDYSYQQT